MFAFHPSTTIAAIATVMSSPGKTIASPNSDHRPATESPSRETARHAPYPAAAAAPSTNPATARVMSDRETRIVAM